MRASARIGLLLAIWCVALVAAVSARAGIEEALNALGGKPCPASEFTCVTLTVPLDHFDPSETRTIDVVFAVLPATGRSKGLFVTAIGGPGSAGIALADLYTSYFDRSITRKFDVVFFDQRGIGLSGGLTCPAAATAYHRSLAPPAEAAARFSADCVSEMGSPAILPYLGTEQAVEDLEALRLALGGPRLWLYGESYGTQYAQAYAAAHPDALEGLILDGTVDLTLTGPEFWREAAGGFERVLEGTLATCDRRPRCREDAGASAGAVFDDLVKRLERKPAPVRFPLPSGGIAERQLTLADLLTVAAGQLYAEGDRMLLQRALAAAGRGDLVPLLRLAYINLALDPQTLAPIPGPTFSDAMYYGVDCQDYAYYAGTEGERAAQYLAEAEAVSAEYPRLGEAVFLSDLPCVYWPQARQDPERPPPLRAEGVPTLVLAASGDPITPLAQGERVARGLADAYLVTTVGGPHVTFGRGNACPDDLVRDFLVDGSLPRRRQTLCKGTLVSGYVPLAPSRATAFHGPRAAFASAERELEYLPEYYYWDFETETSVGCPFGGGTIRFASRGSLTQLRLRRCGFTRGFVMTGTGSWNDDLDRVVLDVEVRGRFAGSYRYERDGDSASVEER